MNYDKHIKTLKATISALDEEYYAETREAAEYYEAKGDSSLAKMHRDILAQMDADPGSRNNPQAG